MSQNNLKNFLSLVLLFVLSSTFFVPSIGAQDEPALIIEVYDSSDWNESVGAIIFEGKSYDITVCTENDSVIMNVTITVMGITYQTNYSEPFITIKAPLFDVSDTVLITAIKEGYQPDILELSVLKGELSIDTDQTIVNENAQFQVTVTDQNNEPLEGALVYITEDDSPILTDQQGRAFARAPEIEIFTSITIQVIKSGYLPGSTTIRIENVETSFFNLTRSQFLQILPILLAVLVIIISILYVFFRQKKRTSTGENHHVEESSDSSFPHKESHQRSKTEPTRSPEKKDFSSVNMEPRVEEIRIPVQAKKKETTIISEEKEDESITEDKEKRQDEWFKGQDYMRYKIDELTGKIDQQTDGKWFEGEQITKYKVDETLKKSLKKKKIDEDTVK